MPALPWTTVERPAPGTEAYVMASRLEVRGLGDVPRILWRTVAVWRQVTRSPGAFGGSLLAQPLRRTFWTLSAWESEAAIRDFTRAEPHRSAMTDLRSATKSASFTVWRIPAAELPVDWAEARRRLAEQEQEQEQEHGAV